MKISPRLAAEWRRKLKASGFEDLESPNEELSSRGTPTFSDHGHAERGDVPVPIQVQVARMRDKEEYAELARDILRHHRFKNPTDREIWRRHVEGEAMHPIASELGLSYYSVRESIIKTWSTTGARTKRTKGRKWLAQHVKQSDLSMLAVIGALLVRQISRMRKRSLTSVWP